MVWPISIRRRPRKHAFEETLDEARLDPESGLPMSDAPDRTAPMMGSLGGIAVASGYVAQTSIARAYEVSDVVLDEDGDRDRPEDAARKLMDDLKSGSHTARELKELRRRFAAKYHPDSVPDELRLDAVKAMAEVNAEIDLALKKLGPAG